MYHSGHASVRTVDAFGNFSGMHVNRVIVTVWRLSNVKRRCVILLSSFDWCSAERADFEGACSGNPFDFVVVPNENFVSVDLDMCHVQLGF